MPELDRHADGYVIDRLDPKGIGRIRARLPGVMDETGWLFPEDAADGDGKGEFNPPDVGTEINAWFVAGNPDNGRYRKGHWTINDDGTTKVPSGAVVTADGDNKVYDDGILRVERDDRPGTAGIRFKHSEDGTTFAEYDAVTRRLKFSADSAIEIETLGEVSISGGRVTINDRVVADNQDPI